MPVPSGNAAESKGCQMRVLLGVVGVMERYVIFCWFCGMDLDADDDVDVNDDDDAKKKDGVVQMRVACGCGCGNVWYLGGCPLLILIYLLQQFLFFQFPIPFSPRCI